MFILALLTALATAAGDDDKQDDGKSLMVLPGAFYSQETSVGLAAFGTASFPLRGSGEDTWPSNLTSAVTWTFERQTSFAVWPTFYFGEANDQVLTGEVIVSHYPTRYYGMGSRSDAAWQDFTRRWLTTDLSVLQKVRPKLYVGGTHRLAVLDVRDVADPRLGDADAAWTGGDLLGSGVVGEDGGRVHGLGVVLRWDGRDNDQSTRRGSFVQVEWVGHPEALGSSWSYGQGGLDTRTWLAFGRDGTLAAQWVSELGHGDVPFTHMAMLGGDDVLRGLFEGRFRDKGMTALQGEVRYTLIGGLRAAAFGGVGTVFSDLPGLADARATATAGGGLRYELDAQSHTAIRADLGTGPDGTGFILTFGEAF